MDVHARLRRAREKHQLLRIERVIPRADPVEGYVLDVGTEWVLLATLDPALVLDGFTAVRIADISVAGKQTARAFIRRALELHGEWPPSSPAGEIPLDHPGELLAALGAGRPLVTIHVERDVPDVCYIGSPGKVGRRKLHLREVSYRAKWDEETSKWSLADLTRIEFGRRYEQALFDIAGDGLTAVTLEQFPGGTGLSRGAPVDSRRRHRRFHQPVQDDDTPARRARRSLRRPERRVQGVRARLGRL
ncbi:hypothetical protein [Amycolatopsis sp. H20-H5]|uniref:hypothetical protein n=1 Tax=Amycolatopsis sp. H20-H5 TaxID=3046309 RepID=UPI002DBBA695|nr:hypothetical protein [Amycolatopsis sp. H20-H5]MEC3977823.1 hypothetical protein [Amycolatopsis sp. H20-H5]